MLGSWKRRFICVYIATGMWVKKEHIRWQIATFMFNSLGYFSDYMKA